MCVYACVCVCVCMYVCVCVCIFLCVNVLYDCILLPLMLVPPPPPPTLQPFLNYVPAPMVYALFQVLSRSSMYINIMLIHYSRVGNYMHATYISINHYNIYCHFAYSCVYSFPCSIHIHMMCDHVQEF